MRSLSRCHPALHLRLFCNQLSHHWQLFRPQWDGMACPDSTCSTIRQPQTGLYTHMTVAMRIPANANVWSMAHSTQTVSSRTSCFPNGAVSATPEVDWPCWRVPSSPTETINDPEVCQVKVISETGVSGYSETAVNETGKQGNHQGWTHSRVPECPLRRLVVQRISFQRNLVSTSCRSVHFA